MKRLIILALVASVGLVAAVGQNLALNKPTWQLSDFEFGYGKNAVDGNPSTDWMAKSCTHTSKEVDPWWVVDLGADYKVSSVKITNRGDPGCDASPECSTRLRDFNIGLMSSSPKQVYPSPDTYKTIFKHPGPMAPGATENFPTDASISGRYLIIQSLVVGNYLTLCEVEVFAEPEVPVQLPLTVRCDDFANIFVNGQQVGSTTGWDDVWSGVVMSGDLIAVDCLNTGGGGGLIASVGGDNTPTGWKSSGNADPGWNEPNFDDSCWRDPYVIAANGQAWAMDAKFSPDANWIWKDSPTYGLVGRSYFRRTA